MNRDRQVQGRDGEGVVAIVQARMGSSRLPGKVLEEIDGKPMVQRVLERTRAADTVTSVRLATSRRSEDDPLAEFVSSTLGFPTIRGSERDVLARYCRAARDLDGGGIVRITADCPLIDPDVIDRVVECFRRENVEYASNLMPPTFPDGLDTEVLRPRTLRQLAEVAEEQAEREHVTLYLRRRSQQFDVANLRCETDRSDERWTVDYPEDLTLVRAVYDRLGEETAGMEAVLRILDRDPDLRSINQAHRKR